MGSKSSVKPLKKTNALRELDRSAYAYEVATYEYDENDLSGIHAAHGISMNPFAVFKTLVVQGGSGFYAVCMIPVCCELNLKRAAAALGVKAVSMLPLKELLPVTGYIRGGCSPLAMKKKFTTIIDVSCLDHERIAFSAGCRGMQIIMSPCDLIDHAKITTASICVTVSDEE